MQSIKLINPPIPDVLENTSWPLISGSPADVVYPSSAMLCFRSYFKLYEIKDKISRYKYVYSVIPYEVQTLFSINMKF
jgi:hypothetical protein